MALNGGEFGLAGLACYELHVRREGFLDRFYRTLNDETLSFLSLDREARRLERRGGRGHVRVARAELFLKLRWRQPVMVISGGRIGLIFQQLLERVLMRQRQIDIEVGNGVLVCRS